MRWQMIYVGNLNAACLSKLLACLIANYQEEIRYVFEIDNENSFLIIYIFK